jgi:hypothetical protein
MPFIHSFAPSVRVLPLGSHERRGRFLRSAVPWTRHTTHAVIRPSPCPLPLPPPPMCSHRGVLGGGGVFCVRATGIDEGLRVILRVRERLNYENSFLRTGRGGGPGKMNSEFLTCNKAGEVRIPPAVLAVVTNSRSRAYSSEPERKKTPPPPTAPSGSTWTEGAGSGGYDTPRGSNPGAGFGVPIVLVVRMHQGCCVLGTIR